MTRFCRFELRTTDVAAARAFYAAVLGRHVGDGDGGGDDHGEAVVTLPAEAAARGAPAHWLGHLGVADVEATARAFVERGATRLGPTRPARGGGEVAILRDPGGAVVALATPSAGPSPAGVAWHLLDTTDLSRASAAYRDVLGWRLAERIDRGALGVLQPFAWDASGASVGAMIDMAGRPGRHPHWLFHFGVAALEAALAAVAAGGGVVVARAALPDGARIAVCDDAQGAAFALMEQTPATARR